MAIILQISSGTVSTCGIYLYATRLRKILACHATHAGWNKWSIPKGLKKPGEDPYKTAVREMEEETGLDISGIHVLHKIILPPVKYRKQNKVLLSYLVITDSDLEHFNFHCTSLTGDGFPETDKWKWIDPVNDRLLLHESQQENLEKVIQIAGQQSEMKPDADQLAD